MKRRILTYIGGVTGCVQSCGICEAPHVVGRIQYCDEENGRPLCSECTRQIRAERGGYETYCFWVPKNEERQALRKNRRRRALVEELEFALDYFKQPLLTRRDWITVRRALHAYREALEGDIEDHEYKLEREEWRQYEEYHFCVPKNEEPQALRKSRRHRALVEELEFALDFKQPLMGRDWITVRRALRAYWEALERDIGYHEYELAKEDEPPFLTLQMQ